MGFVPFLITFLADALSSRKDLSLKDCKIDILLITGMLSPYSTVVEKLHRDVNKERVTMMKVERAGDVLVDAVSEISIIQSLYSKSKSSLNIMASVTIDQ